MFLSFSLLRLLLFQRLILGKPLSETLFLSSKAPPLSSTSVSSVSTVKSSLTKPRLDSELTPLLPKIVPRIASATSLSPTGRQFESLVGFIVAITLVANIANIILYAIPIIIDVIIGIVIAAVVGYLLFILKRLIFSFLKNRFGAFTATKPFLASKFFQKLYNGRVGTKLRRLLLKLQTTLEDVGLLKHGQKLAFFNFFTSQPTDWSHFTESEWPITQIHLVRQKMAHLRRDVHLMDRYLEQLSAQRTAQLRRDYEKYLCLKGAIKCSATSNSKENKHITKKLGFAHVRRI